jgi:hypothetical protein
VLFACVRRLSQVEREEMEMEKFMQEIEEDPEVRAGVNLYKKKAAAGAQKAADAGVEKKESDGTMGEDEEEDGFPEVQMAELLDDMQELAVHDVDPDAGDEADSAEGGPEVDMAFLEGKREFKQGGFAEQGADILNPYTNASSSAASSSSSSKTK